MMSAVVAKTQDAEATFVDRSPRWAEPYLRLMRVDRPIGVWLLWIPCLWGLIIARPPGMTAGAFWWLAGLFLVGSFVMRSAGCVYNDYIDRDLDRSVARTRDRPLASGAVTPQAAIALVVGLCLIGLVVLLQLGGAAIAIGVGSLGLVAAYPFAKRVTWWPQLWLGLTFNWGVLVAGAASGGLSVSVALAYAAGIFWTLGYDTIYALQDIEDDAMAGIRSSARRLGAGVRQGVAVFYALCLAAMALAMVTGGASLLETALLLPAALHFAAQVIGLEPAAPRRNLLLFKANIWPGLSMAMALFAV